MSTQFRVKDENVTEIIRNRSYKVERGVFTATDQEDIEDFQREGFELVEPTAAGGDSIPAGKRGGTNG